jgi:hypothetical protein
LGVFLGTALLVTLRQHQLRLQQLNRVDSIDVGDDMNSLDDLPVCQVVFVLGGPGSARAHECVVLIPEQEWAFSAGDLLRAERTSNGPIGDLDNKGCSGTAGTGRNYRLALGKWHENIVGKSSRLQISIDGYPRNQANDNDECRP